MFFSLRLGDILEHMFRYRALERKLIDTLPLIERRKIEEILIQAVERGYVSVVNDKYVLVDPLEMVVYLITLGFSDIERLVNFIDWSEFENYIAQVLQLAGFDVYSNYQHRGLVRFQIDVLGLDSVRKLGLVIECKHWRSIRKYGAKLIEAARNHIRRVEQLIKFCEWVVINIPTLRRIKTLIPVIVVLKSDTQKVVDNIPIVSITELRDFLLNIEKYVDELELKAYSNKCYVE